MTPRKQSNSCAAYDRGQIEEAVRIGTSLRVLLHDTNNSTSLLSHLNAKNIPLVSTCPVNEVRPGVFFEGLAAMSFNASGVLFHPKLDSPTDFEMPADLWWEQIVLGLGNGHNLSRKVFARTAANKDGGAHVDDKLPDEYAQLVDGVWTMYQGGQRTSIVSNHHLLYLRQMGYEILSSPRLRELIESSS